MKLTMKAVLAAVLAGLVFATVAVAHTARYDTTVTAKVKKGGKEAGTFSGEVASPSRRCVAGRTVEVHLRNDSPPDTLVGSDETDTAGAWELVATSELAAGTYYAVVAKKVIKKNKRHRHICKRAQSGDLEVK